MKSAPSDWWKLAFHADYLQRYAHRDGNDAEALLNALQPWLLQAPGPIIDVGCGAGRHLQRLRQRGYQAFGLDYSWDLLTAGADSGPRVLADMRQPPFAPGFGAALFLFTAFGYFDEATNINVLRTWGRLLSPDGFLIIDVPDPARLVLAPDGVRDGPGHMRIHEKRCFDGQRVMKHVVMEQPGQATIERWESVRLYGVHAWPMIAFAAGLSWTQCPHPEPTRLLMKLTRAT